MKFSIVAQKIEEQFLKKLLECLNINNGKRKPNSNYIETDDNLNRVLDILHELDDRMEPLQIQASLASDYLTMSEELKDIEIAVIAHDLRLCVSKNTVLHTKNECTTRNKTSTHYTFKRY